MGNTCVSNVTFQGNKQDIAKLYELSEKACCIYKERSKELKVLKEKYGNSAQFKKRPSLFEPYVDSYYLLLLLGYVGFDDGYKKFFTWDNEKSKLRYLSLYLSKDQIPFTGTVKRTFITNIEDPEGGDYMSFTMDSNWDISDDLIKAIANAKCFSKPLDYYFIAEEPSGPYFVKHDPDNKFYKDEYYVDFCVDDIDFCETEYFFNDEETLSWIKNKIKETPAIKNLWPHGNPSSLSLQQLMDMEGYLLDEANIKLEIRRYEPFED